MAVFRTGSFTRAASEMNVTQPTISNGIRELEQFLDVRLFNREGRKVSLTMEGRTLVTYAIQIQDLVVEMENRVRSRDKISEIGFQFGAIDAAVIYLLPEILKGYLKEYSNLKLSVKVGPSRYLVEDLLQNKSEFAVISLPYTQDDRIETVSIYRDSMPLVVGATHPFVGKTSVTLKEVIQETLILFHNDSVSRKVVDDRFSRAGLFPKVIMELRSPEAMLKLVEIGVGISFLPLLTIRDSLSLGTLHSVEVEGVTFGREIGMAWRKGRYFGPTIQFLIDTIFQQYKPTSI